MSQRGFAATVSPDNLTEVAMRLPSGDQLIQPQRIGRVIFVRKQVWNHTRANAVNRERVVGRGLYPIRTDHGSSPMIDRLTDVKLGVEFFVEVKHAIEMVLTILFGFFHQSDVDHVEHDVSKAIRFVDTPIVQNDLGHVAELVESVLPDRLTKLLAGQVTFATGLVK